MTTRTTGLVFELLTPAKTSLLYTCPVGTVTIVKSINFLRYAPVSALRIYALRPTANAAAYIMSLDPTGTLVEGVSCWVVLEAGDQLHHDAVSANVGLLISGTELLAP